MSSRNSIVATFEKHNLAEDAVHDLKAAGFDMKSISIVGKDFHTDEHVTGYYTTADRMKSWGVNGAFWGGIWGLLLGSAVFVIPGVGPIVAAGPIVAWIVGALGAVVVGGVSTLGAALYSVGIPKQSIMQYETSLQAGHFVLVVHGTADEVTRAKTILEEAGVTKADLHLTDAPMAVAH